MEWSSNLELDKQQPPTLDITYLPILYAAVNTEVHCECAV